LKRSRQGDDRRESNGEIIENRPQPPNNTNLGPCNTREEYKDIEQIGRGIPMVEIEEILKLLRDNEAKH